MDSDVLAAMARWPDVPDAYGWLSLDARGRWRLHPAGDALAGGPGVSISNTGIRPSSGATTGTTNKGAGSSRTARSACSSGWTRRR